MTWRIIVALLAGLSAVLAIVAAGVLWWMSHARTSTKGWIGHDDQVAKKLILKSLKRGRRWFSSPALGGGGVVTGDDEAETRPTRIPVRSIYLDEVPPNSQLEVTKVHKLKGANDDHSGKT